MSTNKLIWGLQLLDQYRNDPGGYNVGADHDVIYAFPTDRPLSPEHVEEMIRLEWHQDDCIVNGEFLPANYDPCETWCWYT